MALTKAKRKPVSVNPRTLLLYGAPKVGKTTVLSQLKDCLVIDTESGSSMLEGYFHNVDSKDELINFYKEAEEGHEYKYFALDTIDKIVEWTEKAVCSEFEIESINDLPFGKGFGLVRQRVLNNVKKLLSLCPHIIIIGHRKVASAIDNSNSVDPESLDISGRLKNMLMAQCDAIGYMFRDEEDELNVSFKASGALEAGSRCNHLKGKVFKFDWNKIYLKKGGK
tara:strand:+ start:831 stop:1502 length:672 start_codon:yes stop_codon:yes gene_type:complete